MGGAIVVFAVSYARLRTARSVHGALPWARLAGRTGWLFPVSVLGLFASGAFLTSDQWTWSTPWIDAAVAGLVLVSVQGPVVGGPPAQALDRALRSHAPGALDVPVRRLARARPLWFVVCVNPAIVLAVVWIMTAKPGAAAAIGALAAAYVVGVAATLLLSRAPAGDPAP